ncbi:MAG: hypothetical protein JST24_01335 [Acidobacteria bacterium]|nr:hypothetical protein [Acidobacteriota bacterium]
MQVKPMALIPLFFAVQAIHAQKPQAPRSPFRTYVLPEPIQPPPPPPPVGSDVQFDREEASFVWAKTHEGEIFDLILRPVDGIPRLGRSVLIQYIPPFPGMEITQYCFVEARNGWQYQGARVAFPLWIPISDLHRAHPDWTPIQIADAVKVTRIQGVWDIKSLGAKKLGHLIESAPRRLGRPSMGDVGEYLVQIRGNWAQSLTMDFLEGEQPEWEKKIRQLVRMLPGHPIR